MKQGRPLRERTCERSVFRIGDRTSARTSVRTQGGCRGGPPALPGAGESLRRFVTPRPWRERAAQADLNGWFRRSCSSRRRPRAWAVPRSGFRRGGVSFRETVFRDRCRRRRPSAFDNPRRGFPGPGGPANGSKSSSPGPFSAQGAPHEEGFKKGARAVFVRHGAWPAPRGVRSAASAARDGGFPGPPSLTPLLFTIGDSQAQQHFVVKS